MKFIGGGQRMNKVISFIVPAFNAASSIEKCINSMLKQTYKNIEIVIIDDGSTDCTFAICSRLATEHPEIKVYGQENKGVSAARNYGLEVCSGDYVSFVDSDDYIDQEYGQILLNAIQNHNQKISCCYETLKPWPEAEESVYKLENYLFTQRDAHLLAWGALYDISILQGLRFNETIYLAEDTLFFSEALKRAKGLVHTHKKLYHYTIAENTASHGKFDEKKYTEFEAWDKILMLFRDYPDIQNSCKAEYASLCCRRYKQYFYDCGFSEEKKKNLLHRYRENYNELIKTSRTQKERISYTIFYLAPDLYTRILRKLKNI